MPRMEGGARHYAGQSAEERRVERRGRLITAARELMGEVGWAGTSLRAVSARAGLAVRYFYESFPDRDTLLAALFDDVAAELLLVVAERLQSAPPDLRARARAVGVAVMDLIEAEPGLARVALFETPDSPVIRDHRRAAMRQFVGFLAEEGVMDAQATSTRLDREVIAHAVIGAFQELLIAHGENELAVSRDRLVDHAAAIAEAIVTTTPGSRYPTQHSQGTPSKD